MRGKIFTQRFVIMWNELTDEMREASTTKTFKRHLDRHMDRKDLKGNVLNTGKCDQLR